jgi:hypothetical protein
MYCEPLPLAGNLEQDFALPKILGFCGKSRGFRGELAALVSGHARQTLGGRQLIPAVGFSFVGGGSSHNGAPVLSRRPVGGATQSM